jgi:hypothetical protein
MVHVHAEEYRRGLPLPDLCLQNIDDKSNSATPPVKPF